MTQAGPAMDRCVEKENLLRVVTQQMNVVNFGLFVNENGTRVYNII